MPQLRRFVQESGGKPWAEQLRQAEPAPFQWASPLRCVQLLGAPAERWHMRCTGPPTNL